MKIDDDEWNKEFFSRLFVRVCGTNEKKTRKKNEKNKKFIYNQIQSNDYDDDDSMTIHTFV